MLCPTQSVIRVWQKKLQVTHSNPHCHFDSMLTKLLLGMSSTK